MQIALSFSEPLPRARRSDPSTSHEAAAMATGLAAQHQQRVLHAMRAAGEPVGAEQIAERTGMDAYQVRKRLVELQRAGLIALTGAERPTKSGRRERVWRLRA